MATRRINVLDRVYSMTDAPSIKSDYYGRIDAHQGMNVAYIGVDITIPLETRIGGVSTCGTYIHVETGKGLRSVRPEHLISLDQ